jgi:cell division protein FtsZ
MIQFDLPTKQSSIIKVIGVGGGGGNAVNYMYNQGIDGVDFILCNTDVKALEASNIPLKVQLGPAIAQGLGAGANPEVGEKACEESIAEITNILKDNTKMVFVTAGMGGGTGTGGAPIVSKVAKDLGILTVGIVTTPFSHEGRKRIKQAEEGINKMRGNVDTILVISNDKLRHQFGNLGFREAFEKADDILATATRCITDVINSRGHVIVDFADVCTVMRDGGVAILGSAKAIGENRALEAVEKAINSPLLNDNDISGAKWVLLNINSSEGAHEHTLDEMDIIQNYVQEMAGDNCDVILGTGYDNNLGDAIGITIIATGFEHKDTAVAFDEKAPKPEEIKVIHSLDSQLKANTTPELSTNTPEVSTPEAASTNAPSAFVVEAPKLAEELMPSIVAQVIEEPAFPTYSAMGMRPSFKAAIVPQVEEIIVNTSIELVPEITTIQVATPAIEPATQETKIVYSLQNTESELASAIEEVPVQNSNLQTFQKNENDEFITRDGITIPRKVGSRYLSESEIAEKINFELQKRAFDERAGRLRSISFNIKHPETGDHIESIPAYMRNGKSMEETNTASTDKSDYTVNGSTGEINTKNKWLFNNDTTD